MDFRMININSIIVSGRLTKDPELKYTPKGTPVIQFSIANERSWKNGDTWEKETTFITCQAWSNLAENFAKNAIKGMGIMVEGRLSCRKYTTSEGVNREAWEIVCDAVHVMEWKPKDQDTPQETPPEPSGSGDMPF